MKKLFGILFLALLLLSCGNKKRYTISDVEKFNKQWEEKHRQVDNVKKDEGKDKTENVNHSPGSSSSSSSPSSSSSRSNSSSNYDNMRGFDPASEDDMDDNGMSRYMENYDEEGWD